MQRLVNPPIAMLAVCYRCFYRGAHDETRCPACNFALIRETEEPTKERHLEDIFARYSVAQGAPSLPGVHSRELRRPRFFAQGTQREMPAPERPPLPATPAPVAAPAAEASSARRAAAPSRPVRRGWEIGFAVLGAGAAGAILVLLSGLL